MENQSKILLIEPPFYRLFKNVYSLDRFPLSLGYLSSAVQNKTDWQVKAFNADFYPTSESPKIRWLSGAGFDNYLSNLNDLSKPIWKETELIIANFRPDIIGISCKSQNFKSACNIAKIAKSVNKKILTTVGGPHPTMVGPQVLNEPEIDIGVIGEAEQTMINLLNAFKGNMNLESVDGICFRQNDKVQLNLPREFITDLDSLGFPFASAQSALMDYEKYPITAFRNIFATRGCPFNCFFCGSRKIWSRQVRFRSPKNVIEEIKCLQKIGLKSVNFDDDNFGGGNKKYIIDLCNVLIAHTPKIKWSCEINVKLVDEEIVSLMKNAGCYQIALGVESGNNDILRQMRKGITVEEALKAANIVKKHGLITNVFFIVGFPQETESTLNDTFKAMKTIDCNQLAYSIFTPYPGTEAFDFCAANNLVKNDFDVSLYNHQSPANCFCLNFSPERFRVCCL